MKFKTFESLLQNCLDLYNAGCARDKVLSDAFGGDTNIMTDWWDTFIEETLESIKAELNDDSDTIDWLFWDNMTMNNEPEYQTFEVDGVEYIGNPKNIYLELTGMLDEKIGDTVHKDTSDDIKISSENLVKVHDKEKIKEIDMTHLVPGDNPWKSSVIQELDKLEENEDKNISEDKTTQFNKKLLLKDKQIELESIQHSDILAKEVELLSLFNENVSVSDFEIELNKVFESLKLDSKHKDTLVDMNNKIRMVLLQFTTEPINKEIASMINFEIQKVFNNLKEFKRIFDYKVEKADIKGDFIRIEGTWLWEDINEREKSFGINIGEEIKIEFN